MSKFKVHVEFYTMVEADSAEEAECMVEDSDLPADAEVLDIGAEPVLENGLRCPLCGNDVQIGLRLAAERAGWFVAKVSQTVAHPPASNAPEPENKA